MLQRILGSPRRRSTSTGSEPPGQRPRAAPRCRASSPPSGWTASATTSTTSTGRRRSPTRRSRGPEDLRAAPGPPAGPPRQRRQDPRRGRRGGAAGKTGRIFVGNEMSSRATRAAAARRGRRPALVRRRRPFRRRGAPLHRRPRRRDDRLRRRERVPARGRGPAVRPRDGRRGRGDRRRRRGVRPAPEGVRRSSARRELCEDDVKGYVKQNLANYKVPREVEFLDALPRNATGKVLKRELADDLRRLERRARRGGGPPLRAQLARARPGASAAGAAAEVPTELGARTTRRTPGMPPPATP